MTMPDNTRHSRAALAALFSPAVLGLLLGLRELLPLPAEQPEMLESAGKLCAFAAIGLAPAMAALGSRQPHLERRLGLERMLRIHALAGKGLVALLLAHASLMYAEFMAITGRSLLQTAQSFANLWEMLLGMTALTVVLLAAAPASITPVLWKLRRERTLQGKSAPAWLPPPPPFVFWKPLHLLLYAALPAGMAHGFFRGEDMNDPLVLGFWLLCLTLFTLLALQRGALFIKGTRRSRMRVAEVRMLNHDVAAIELTPEKGRTPGHVAGQFMLLRIAIKGRLSEPHPFTISSPPSAGAAPVFTVKRGGRFTRALHQLPPGAEVRCEGPYGVFCREAALAGHGPETRPLALLAGGVGITPFLSLLREMAAQRHGQAAGGERSRQVHLVWANKTVADAFALDELKELSRSLDLSVTHVFSRETAPEGLGVDVAHGHVTRELLQRLFSGRESFYLCGPPAMQQSVLRLLRAAFGIHASDIERELFTW